MEASRCDARERQIQMAGSTLRNTADLEKENLRLRKECLEAQVEAETAKRKCEELRDQLEDRSKLLALMRSQMEQLHLWMQHMNSAGPPRELLLPPPADRAATTAAAGAGSVS